MLKRAETRAARVRGFVLRRVSRGSSYGQTRGTNRRRWWRISSKIFRHRRDENRKTPMKNVKTIGRAEWPPLQSDAVIGAVRSFYDSRRVAVLKKILARLYGRRPRRSARQSSLVESCAFLLFFFFFFFSPRIHDFQLCRAESV